MNNRIDAFVPDSSMNWGERKHKKSAKRGLPFLQTFWKLSTLRAGSDGEPIVCVCVCVYTNITHIQIKQHFFNDEMQNFCRMQILGKQGHIYHERGCIYHTPVHNLF